MRQLALVAIAVVIVACQADDPASPAAVDSPDLVASPSPTTAPSPARPTGPPAAVEERDLGDYASVVEMRELLEEEGMVCVDWWEGYILHTRTAGRCYLDDDRRLELTTFRTVEAQREYLELIDEFGGVAVTGDLWAVVVDTIGQAETVQGALGGVIY